MSMERFAKVYSNVSPMRKEIVIVINGQPISWEVKDKTKLGEEIQKR